MPYPYGRGNELVNGVIFLTREVAASDCVCYTTEVAALGNTRVF